MGGIGTSLPERTREMRERHAVDPPSPKTTRELVTHPEPSSQPVHDGTDNSWDPTLIPDPGPSRHSPEDNDIDVLIEGVGIVDAYTRWCGKVVPNDKGRSESIMISCPVPGHKDANPSAWINSKKGTWYCAVCEQGGDKYDLAAWHHGMDVPGYKHTSFPELRRKIAEDLGYVVRRTPGGRECIEIAQTEDETTTSRARDAVTAASAANSSDSVPASPTAAVPPLDWRAIVAPDTFLWHWLAEMTTDDLPEEYHFWLGATAVGLAAGNDAVLTDRPVVRGNLFVCLVGPTGLGKSKSILPLRELLHRALPYDYDNPASKGVKAIDTVASAEALVDAFSSPELDAAHKATIANHPVRGLVKFGELANFLGRAIRQGSVLKPRLIDFYDGIPEVEERSRNAGFVVAVQPFCSMLSTTQTKSLGQLLGQADVHSGFMNRWVFVFGGEKELKAFVNHNPDLTTCVESLRNLRRWAAGGGGRQITLDPDATEAYERFFRTTIEPIRRAEGEDLLARADLTIKKLLLLFAVNEQTTVIGSDLVERVLQIWPYLESTYRSVEGLLGRSRSIDCSDAIIQYVHLQNEKHGNQPSARDIHRYLKKRGFEPESIDRNLKILVAARELDEARIRPSSGPTACRYRLAA